MDRFVTRLADHLLIRRVPGRVSLLEPGIGRVYWIRLIMNGPPVSGRLRVFQVVVSAKSAIGETDARVWRQLCRSIWARCGCPSTGSCRVAANKSVPTVVWSAEVVDQCSVFAE